MAVQLVTVCSENQVGEKAKRRNSFAMFSLGGSETFAQERNSVYGLSDWVLVLLAVSQGWRLTSATIKLLVTLSALLPSLEATSEDALPIL